MSSSPTSPRPIWPERWATALRDRLNLLRLLTLVLAALALVGVSAAFGFTADPGRSGAVITLLAALWTWGYRRGGVPLSLVPVELALLLGTFVGINATFGPFGVMFLGLQHRALYGGRRDATLVSTGYGVVVVVGHMLRPLDVTSVATVIVLELVLGAFGAYLMHTVGEVLSRDNERQRELRRSQERYRAMFDHNPWPTWLFDPATYEIIDVNESAIRHYGYSREEFLARSLRDIRPLEDRVAFDAISKTFGSEVRSSHLVRHCKKNGEVISVEVTGHLVELDGRMLRLATGVDVSARERAEHALRESESRFRSVANCLREAVLLADLDDRIVLANESVREVLGYEPEAVIGKLATELLLPADQRDVFRDRMRRRLSGETELYEVELVRADGRRLFAEISASPYRDSTGRIIGTLGAISDVTDRRRLEERVRQSTRLEAVGQLAGGVAHDFNNLLTVIKCHAELLRDDLASVDPQQASVREIERAADRAAEVTGQLLAFSRKQLMQPRRLGLDHVVTEAIPVLRQLAGARVEIATSSDGSGPAAFADPTQLENVLLTLVRNACEAMPRGGRITIGTETRDVAERDLGQNQHMPAGTYTVLSVSDTGPGMDTEIQRRLFEPFFTTKEVGSGSGLGLASLFGIVRQSGGYVDVSSSPGRGTSFTIFLPSASQPAAMARSAVA